MKKNAVLAALAAAAFVSGCGGSDDGSPTASENEQLNQAAQDLDTSPDSLAVEEADLGNGEAGAETGDVLVADNGAGTGISAQ
jgi:hypothetical protein